MRWRQLALARRLRHLDTAGRDDDVIAAGEAFLCTYRGSAEIHELLAGAYWGRSRWEDSVRHGRRALALRPSQTQAVVFLLSNYRHLKRHERGLQLGHWWIQRYQADAVVCRHLSLLHDDRGDTAAALAVAQQGLARNASDLRLASVAAHFIAKLQGADAALTFAQPYRESFARDAYCESTLADGLAAAGGHAQALPLLEGLMAREPDNSIVFGKLLGVRLALRQFAEVAAAAECWRQTRTLTALIANETGRAHLELGDASAAISWFRQAHELAPDDSRYAANLGVTLGLANRHHECIDFCQAQLQRPSGADRLKLLTAIAIAHTDRGEHEAALPHYQQANKEFPDDPAVQANLLVGLNWLGRYRESVALGEQAARPADRSARFWSELAWAHHQLGQLSAETACLQAWQTLAPEDPDLVRSTVRCLNAQQRSDEATSYARDWVDRHPQNAWGWRHLAEQYHHSGDAEQELAAMEAAYRLTSDDPGFADFKLVTLRRLRRSREALDFGRAWMESHANGVTATLLNRVGLAADDLEDWPAAEAWYRRAHEREPADAAWCGNLLRALVLQKKSAEAVTLGRAWTQRHRMDPYVAGKLAWALRVLGQRAEESEVLAAAWANFPRDEALAYDLFNSLLEQTRTHEAKALLDRLVDEGLATGRFHNNWGNHLRDVSRMDEAEAAYRRGLEVDPDNQTLTGNLASLFVAQNRTTAAVALCETWLSRRPEDLYVRRQRAHAQYELGHYAAAEKDYAIILEHEPSALALVGRRVACLRLSGRHEEALAAGQQWLATQEADPFLLTEVGIACRRLRRETEALDYFNQALLRNPNWPSAAYWKLETLGTLGRTDEAIAFGLAWTERHDAAADFCNELAILLDRAGETQNAERQFCRAAELDPEDATLAGNAVEIVTRQGRFEEAIRLGQRSLWQAPPNAYLLRRLAEAYSRHDEHHAALDLLHRADELAPSDVHVASSYLRIADASGELISGIAFARAWLKRTGNESQALIWSWFARILFHHDEEAEAYEAPERARELEPDNIRHTRLLISFLLSDGQYLRLTELFEGLRVEWQDDHLVLQRTSRAYLEMGIHVEALRLALKAVQLHPLYGSCVAWLASVHRQMGDMDAARDLLDRWSRQQPNDPHVAVARAQLTLESGAWAEALAQAEAALALDPSSEEAFVVQVRALRELRRTERARTLLHRWIEHHRPSGSVARLLEEIDEDRRS